MKVKGNRRIRGTAPAALALLLLAALAPAAPAEAQAPEAARQTDRERVLTMWARSHYPGRSGDIMLVPREGEQLTDVPFMHGSPWDYDARVPLLLHGPGHVRAGTYEEPASHEDIGATLGMVLGLPPRPVQTGRALSGAFRSPPPRPRAVVLVVLDGFGAGVLERYREELPVWRRLQRDGAWFPEARAAVLPTATSVAHAGMSTGTDPAVHGIVGNNPWDRVRGRAVEMFPGASPDNLTALSVADRWSAATDGRAVIYAQGGTDYPAAALAGHGACHFAGRPVLLAYLERNTGSWETNGTCYEIPDSLASVTLRGLVEEAREAGTEREPTRSRSVVLTRFAPRLEGRASVTVVETEPVGADTVTDLLLLNWKTPDYVGHAYGPESVEMAEAVVEMDRQLGHLVDVLDARVGPEEYVLIVTADHGVPPEPGEERGRHAYDELVAAVKAEFDPEGSGFVHFPGGADLQLYLDRERMEALEVEPAEVARFLETLPYIAHAFTAAEVSEARVRRDGS